MCAGTGGAQGFRSSVAGVTDSCEDLMCVLGTALVSSSKAVCILKSCPPLLHLRTLFSLSCQMEASPFSLLVATLVLLMPHIFSPKRLEVV